MHIKLENISKTYQVARDHAVQALQPASLEIMPGEFVVITGRSGSGKTTLLNLISGLTRPTGGLILFDDIYLCAIRAGSMHRNWPLS